MAGIRHDGKFVAYHRVVSHGHAGSQLSIEKQQDKVRTTLNGGTWLLIGEYIEIEGKQSRRPMLQEALAFAQKHGATLIMATIDPLRRNAYSSRWCATARFH